MFQTRQKKLEKFWDPRDPTLSIHSDDLLRQFCSKGWVLRNGRICFKGNLEDALSFYNSKEYENA